LERYFSVEGQAPARAVRNAPPWGGLARVCAARIRFLKSILRLRVAFLTTPIFSVLNDFRFAKMHLPL